MSHTNAARPKRAGEEYVRTHQGTDDDHVSKKPRFDLRNPSTLAPDAREEDDVLALDEIGGGFGTKRNAVNIDGYESDSDNDNFDDRAKQRADDEKKGQQKSKDEDEDDMFADLEQQFGDGDRDEDLDAEGKQKKGVRFLDNKDIEGQVDNSKAGGHVDADLSLKGKKKQVDEDESDSGEEADEMRDRVPMNMDEELGAGSKKKHAPRLDAFNMKSEQEEGRFDEHGNFVRKAMDPDAQYDNWLDGVSKKDIKKAREAQEKLEQEKQKQNRKEDEMLASDLLKTLILQLEKEETPMEALQRLNKNRKPQQKKKPKWQQKKKQANGGMEVDEEKQEEDTRETKLKEAINEVTDTTSSLFNKGMGDIYNVEREDLVRLYQRDSGEKWVDPPAQDDEASEANNGASTKQWQYRWTDDRDAGEIHGPYDGQTMSAWSAAGYFPESIEFKEVGHETWAPTVEFV